MPQAWAMYKGETRHTHKGMRSTWLARRMREERLARCMSPDMRLVMECRLHSAALLCEAPPSLERLGLPKMDSLQCIPSHLVDCGAPCSIWRPAACSALQSQSAS